MTRRFRPTNCRRWGTKKADRIGRQRLLHARKYGAKGGVVDKVHSQMTGARGGRKLALQTIERLNLTATRRVGKTSFDWWP